MVSDPTSPGPFTIHILDVSSEQRQRALILHPSADLVAGVWQAPTHFGAIFMRRGNSDYLFLHGGVQETEIENDNHCSFGA